MPKLQIELPISEANWIKHIETLQNIENIVGTKQNITTALKTSIIRDLPKEPFGILLSGGVDSSIIAKICKDQEAPFRCFCVGIKGSEDLKVSKEIARILKLELITKEFELDEIEQLLLKVIKYYQNP